MTANILTSSGDSLIAPARHAFAIVANNTSNLPTPAKAVYVGTGGDLVLRAIGSSTDVTFRNVSGGSILAVRTVAVRADGTTAADLVGLL
jgi:hypothetical protein